MDLHKLKTLLNDACGGVGQATHLDDPRPFVCRLVLTPGEPEWSRGVDGQAARVQGSVADWVYVRSRRNQDQRGGMNQHQSIIELYNTLCGKFRALKKLEDSGERLCRHCTRKQSEHRDDRCDNYATSRSFLPADIEERRKVIESLELIEKLASVNGWDFS